MANIHYTYIKHHVTILCMRYIDEVLKASSQDGSCMISLGRYCSQRTANYFRELSQCRNIPSPTFVSSVSVKLHLVCLNPKLVMLRILLDLISIKGSNSFYLRMLFFKMFTSNYTSDFFVSYGLRIKFVQYLYSDNSFVHKTFFDNMFHPFEYFYVPLNFEIILFLFFFKLFLKLIAF